MHQYQLPLGLFGFLVVLETIASHCIFRRGIASTVGEVVILRWRLVLLLPIESKNQKQFSNFVKTA
jgi:hypothetical protein